MDPLNPIDEEEEEEEDDSKPSWSTADNYSSRFLICISPVLLIESSLTSPDPPTL